MAIDTEVVDAVIVGRSDPLERAERMRSGAGVHQRQLYALVSSMEHVFGRAAVAELRQAIEETTERYAEGYAAARQAHDEAEDQAATAGRRVAQLEEERRDLVAVLSVALREERARAGKRKDPALPEWAVVAAALIEVPF